MKRTLQTIGRIVLALILVWSAFNLSVHHHHHDCRHCHTDGHDDGKQTKKDVCSLCLFNLTHVAVQTADPPEFDVLAFTGAAPPEGDVSPSETVSDPRRSRAPPVSCCS